MEKTCAKKMIFKCAKCGRVIEVMFDTAAPVVICCGEPMQEQKSRMIDASVEKHVPVIAALKDGGVKVVVGAQPHPMTAEHYIMWIEVLNGCYVNRKYLAPGSAPEAEFYVPYSDKLIVRAYCNLHGLWEK